MFNDHMNVSPRFIYVEGETKQGKNFFVDTTNAYFNEFTLVWAWFDANEHMHNGTTARHSNGDEKRFTTLHDALNAGYAVYPQDKPETISTVTSDTKELTNMTHVETSVIELPNEKGTVSIPSSMRTLFNGMTTLSHVDISNLVSTNGHIRGTIFFNERQHVVTYGKHGYELEHN